MSPEYYYKIKSIVRHLTKHHTEYQFRIGVGFSYILYVPTNTQLYPNILSDRFQQGMRVIVKTYELSSKLSSKQKEKEYFDYIQKDNKQ